jgi:hypothetical protein
VWKAVLTLDRSRKMKVAVCYFGSLFALLARLFMSPYTVLVSDCYSELNRFSSLRHFCVLVPVGVLEYTILTSISLTLPSHSLTLSLIPNYLFILLYISPC